MVTLALLTVVAASTACRTGQSFAPSAPPAEIGPAEQHGAWELEPLPAEPDRMQAVHAILLPSGKVLIVNGSSLRVNRLHRWYGKAWREIDGTDASATDETALFDPSAPPGPERFERIASPENPFEGEANDLFCGGHLHTPAGDVLFTGGTRRSFRTPISFLRSRIAPAFAGTRVANLFDWRTETWTGAWTLRDGHWYPTLVALADGRIVTISGFGYELKSGNSTWVEIFDPADESWASIDIKGLENSPFGAPIDGCEGCLDWMDHYPRIHPLPDGRFLISGDGSGGGNPRSRQTYLMTVGSVTGGPKISFERGAQREGSRRTYNTAVAVPSSPGDVLLIGGKSAGQGPLTEPGGGPKAPDDSVTTDMERYFAPTPESPQGRWERVRGFLGPEPTDARVNHYATLLPTKQILIIGGGLYRFYEPNYHPLLLTPSESASGGFERRLMNPGSLPRLYHTTALLLPDGRVLVAGGNASYAAREVKRDGTVDIRVDTEMRRSLPPFQFVDSESSAIPAEIHQLEMFSPPYLFLPGPRPGIREAPPSLAYGETHTARVEHATPDASLVLIKLGSSTHGWDMGQHFVDLELESSDAESGALTFRAPADRRAAPPGYYMLFYVNATGKPSVAPIVRLGDASERG